MQILLVQENIKQSRFLRRALQEASHAVDLIDDGNEAIHCSLTVGYDLIILDWALPAIDGPGVCRILRDQGSNVPILMLSAKTEVGERIMGLDSGADDYLMKPFDIGELLARVRALGRRLTGMRAHVRVGPLVLDRLARNARLNGQTVGLTPREFTLLTYLAREAGRVVPRSELVHKVWASSYEPGSNIVDAHVKKLRGKLGDCASLIETVRGVGYRMGASQVTSPYASTAAQ
jgi:two-component system OmpR family response regulator